MATLSKSPRFVIVFDDGQRMNSETVYQSEIGERITRLSQCGQRINDVAPLASEADEEAEFEAYLAHQQPEHMRPF